MICAVKLIYVLVQLQIKPILKYHCCQKKMVRAQCCAATLQETSFKRIGVLYSQLWRHYIVM